MNAKLQEILNKINIDESYFNLFFNARILKTKIDDLKNSVSIEIYNEMDIPYTFYQELENKFKDFFDGADILLKIMNEKEVSDYFKINYDKVLNDHKEEFPNVNALIDKMEFFGNSLDIKVVNAREKKDLDRELVKLSKYLEKYGTNFSYNITIDENIKIAIDEDINN